MKQKPFLTLLLAGALLGGLAACTGNKSKTKESEKMEKKYPVTLMTLEPGHFHAALVQKSMYDEVNPTAYVYAPEGPELQSFLDFIQQFNSRADNPTAWKEVIYDKPDYFEKMLQEKPGNVVVLSGNNARKTEYILKSVEAGLNVYADKPMVITPEAYPLLVKAFKVVEEKGLLLYDIMTERFEITAILQKELARIPTLFGELQPGTPDNPSRIQESIHRYYKNVAGKPLVRPAWFFDVSQQGEGIVDVETHLVDLIMWGAFPEQTIEEKDVSIVRTRRWTTDLDPSQFETVTGLKEWPDYLKKYVEDGLLKVYSNGTIIFEINGINAKASVEWTYHTPESSDTHYSLMRGTGCDLIISQKEKENYHPTLYIKAAKGTDLKKFGGELDRVMTEVITPKYPGVAVEKIADDTWKVIIPKKYDVGHEAHFGQVTENYLDYLTGKKTLPAWEVPNMITKYRITTEGLKRAMMR
jgi:predicted dehydrogenase